MSNIREVEFGRPESNPDVVGLLEEWLSRAKDGKLHAVAIAAVHPDGAVSTDWSAGGRLIGVIGAVAILNHRVMMAVEL